MSAPFTLEVVEAAAGTTVVRVSGDLDGQTAPKLIAACKQHPDATRVVLNLAGVTFIASSGVGALLAVTEELRRRGRHVRIAAPSPPVQASLRLLNLEPFLQCHATERDALAA